MASHTGVTARRAVPDVRKFLGLRLRELRRHRGLTQHRLGQLSSVSGRFIGEVERGEKSISIENLYRLSVTLEISLTQLSDVRPGQGAIAPDAQKIFALVSGPHRPAVVRRAYAVLRTMFHGL